MATRSARRARLAEPGQVIDRFRLDALLGSGGFGEVWKATPFVEGGELQPVALKLLIAPERTGETSDGKDDDWLNEVRAVQKVDCPAVAPIYDVGVAREQQLAFISMKLLAGETVTKRLERDGRIWWRRALAIARQIAEALGACHATGVMHCDLKPQNIILGDGGEVYVLDFGVARLGADGQQARPTPRRPDDVLDDGGETIDVPDSELPSGVPDALAHQVYGTPGYIAPERYSGEEPSPAGDFYALGVMLYSMMAGRLPYVLESDGESAAPSSENARNAYRAKLQNATINGTLERMADACPDVPPSVTKLVDALLSRNPDDRPSDNLLERIDQVARRPYGFPDPPYVGLAAFDQRRAGAIAGRDADIDKIVAKLEDRRAIVLVGPSGCGKSSLAIAGVAARIDERMLDGADGWKTVVVRPNEGSLRQGAGGATGELGIVVVIDQLEEVLGIEGEDYQRFVDAIVSLVKGTGPVVADGEQCGNGRRVRVIATVRDDLFGRVAALPELERIPEQSVFTVRGIEPNEMEDVVVRPAQEAGYELQGADDVTADAQRLLARDSSALPLVQFALTQWWLARDRGNRVMTRRAWTNLGGIEGALAQAAEALHSELAVEDRPHLKTVLLELFGPDGTRNVVRERSLGANVGTKRVVDALIDRRLVRRRADTDEPGLEVLHEALAERWPPLRSWLEETRAIRELIAEATYEAERWRNEDEPADLLWRGARLAAAEEARDNLHPGALDFIDEGLRTERRHARIRRILLGAFGTIGAAAAIAMFLAMSLSGERDAAVAKAEARRQEIQSLDDEVKRKQAEVAAQQKALDNAMLQEASAKKKGEKHKEDADKAVAAAGAAEKKANDAVAKAKAERKTAQNSRANLEKTRKALEKERTAKEAQATKYNETLDKYNKAKTLSRPICKQLFRDAELKAP